MWPPLDPALALILALAFLVVAGAIWYVLVRPVPERTGTGVITACTFQAAQVVERSVPRTVRSLEYTPQNSRHTLPDRHVYRIRLDGDGREVVFTSPAVALPPLEVGCPVRLVFIERHIPLVGARVFVKEMTVADARSA